MGIAILFRNTIGNVVLLDLPRSLECAQASLSHILSVSPIAQPWPSSEPKGAKLTRALASINPFILRHDRQLQAEIGAALQEVCVSREAAELPWCLPRSLALPRASSRDRKGLGRSSSCSASERPRDPEHGPEPLVLSPLAHANRFTSLSPLESAAIFNSNRSSNVVILPETKYFVPPSSCFILASIRLGFPAFEEAIAIANVRFDLILMDPPWANRSVRHSRTYPTVESQTDDPFTQSLPIIKEHFDQSGTVAIWVTNKSTVRAQVEHSLGEIGLHLHEEWIWTKVTSRGEPVTALDGVWRSPYEILLIFRRSKPAAAPSKKFIFAVPDAHSRKPSLKVLFEEFLRPEYKALELFARSLTAGWWSWGDEVLKFQDVTEWTTQKPTTMVNAASCQGAIGQG